MADVTNPGLVDVVDETYGNPDPNGGTAKYQPRELDVLTDAADQGFSPPANAGADSSVFPTPAEIYPDEVAPPSPPVLFDYPPDAPDIDVADQSIGQGSMQLVDPGNPAAGYRFVPVSDFIVVGPAESFQTNAVDETEVPATITAVLDADALPAAATTSTTRYYLELGPPELTSYSVSLLGRQVIFADDTTTSDDAGASRNIANYGKNFIVINRDDSTESNGDVATLTLPVAGDVIFFDVNRQGSEQVNTEGGTIDVYISPSPPVNVPLQFPSFDNIGNVDISTGPQPGQPGITSGTIVPTASTVEVADTSQVVGLPTNVFV